MLMECDCVFGLVVCCQVVWRCWRMFKEVEKEENINGSGCSDMMGWGWGIDRKSVV